MYDAAHLLGEHWESQYGKNVDSQLIQFICHNTKTRLPEYLHLGPWRVAVPPESTSWLTVPMKGSGRG